MTYDEYDLQIVTIDVYPRLCKCDYKLITLRDLPRAPLHHHYQEPSNHGRAEGRYSHPRLKMFQ